MSAKWTQESHDVWVFSENNTELRVFEVNGVWVSSTTIYTGKLSSIGKKQRASEAYLRGSKARDLATERCVILLDLLTTPVSKHNQLDVPIDKQGPFYTLTYPEVNLGIRPVPPYVTVRLRETNYTHLQAVQIASMLPEIFNCIS